MKGRLGGLFSGEQQVGGILDWEFEPLFIEGSDGKVKTFKFEKWRLTAPSYWLFGEVDTVTVRLYHGNRYWEGEGSITSKPKQVYDCLIHEQLEIVGEGQLVEKS